MSGVAKQAGRILNEFDVRPIHFRKSLFVLPANHDLGFGAQSVDAHVTQFKQRQLTIRVNLHTYPSLAALGMRDGQQPSFFPGHAQTTRMRRGKPKSKRSRSE